MSATFYLGVDGGGTRCRARLETEYGPVQVLGDARLEDGKLMRLTAQMPAADLRSGDIAAQKLGAAVDLVVHPGLPHAARAGGFHRHVVTTGRSLLHFFSGDRVECEITPRVEHTRCAAGAETEIFDVVRIVDVELRRLFVVPITQRDGIALVQIDAGIHVVAVFTQIAKTTGDAGLVFAITFDA